MGDRLANKVAVITGGASGIGAATAELFVAEGARVVLGDIQDAEGEAFAAKLGDVARYRHCDVTSEAEVEALVNTAVDEFGKIDIMFNNAGIVGSLGPLEATPAEEWKLTIDILLNGVFYGMKHASKHMKKAGSGSIISMSSVAGVTGGLGPHAYAAAKHAVVGITRNLAAEVCAFGVRVNCIAPYSVATPMVAQAYQAALWLASDDSGYTSGHTLTVDAGITTGSMAGPPRFAEREPMIREAGKTGLD